MSESAVDLSAPLEKVSASESTFDDSDARPLTPSLKSENDLMSESDHSTADPFLQTSVANGAIDGEDTVDVLHVVENGHETFPPDAGVLEERLPESAVGPEVEVSATPAPSSGSHRTVPNSPPTIRTAIKTVGHGPPTPLVKKIINSGTFGAGSVKSAPHVTTKVSASASTPSSAARPTVPAKKPVATSTSSTKPEPKTATTAPAVRRPSVVTKAASTTSAPPVRSSLSSSASARSTTATPSARPPASTTTPKASVTSATRPRASISEESTITTRKTISSRTSTTGSPVKPPNANTSRGRPAGSNASISSIKEVKEDAKALDVLQQELKNLSNSLQDKDAQISALENQLAQFKDESKEKDSAAQAHEADRQELFHAKTSLDSLRMERDSHASALEAIKSELEQAQVSSSTQAELIDTLRDQINILEGEVKDAKASFDALQQSHRQASADAAQSATVEHDALLKAQTDLANIAQETEALRVAHAKSQEEASARMRELEGDAARVVELETELTSLKAEKEELANKVSELEVEILEAKEAVENAEDAQGKLVSRITALEEQLEAAIAASEKQAAQLVELDGDHHETLQSVHSQHEAALRQAKEERDGISLQLSSIQHELENARKEIDLSSETLQSSKEEWDRSTAATHEAHSAQLSERESEIARLTTDLQGQEAKYEAKVDALKLLYEEQVQVAFLKAKEEADAAHRQDLQALRIESQEMSAQLGQGHQSVVDEMKGRHEAELLEQTGALEKKLVAQSLELKATQDDLFKAKATIVETQPEMEALKAQLEQAQQSAAPLVSADHITEIERLTKELSEAKDDVSAHQDILKATQESIREMTNSHAKELEEAAKGRAEETTRLRSTHESEREALSKEKGELLLRLSDLEGELTTLKANATVEPVSPRAGSLAPTVAEGVTKEELQRLHEAHNLKIRDLEAEHEKTLKVLRDEVEAFQGKADELQAEVARKAMEIQYLEQEQDEQTDAITRLKEELTAVGVSQEE